MHVLQVAAVFGRERRDVLRDLLHHQRVGLRRDVPAAETFRQGDDAKRDRHPRLDPRRGVRLGRIALDPDQPDATPRIKAWMSIPLGVVTLAEHFGGRNVTKESYALMVQEVAQYIAPFAAEYGGDLRDMHLLGTSGTVTTLAGVHLNLARYDRRRVDGVWMSDADITATVARLLGMSYQERANNNCISVERADLVLAGCAILDAIRTAFPLPRLRVADRGLREGMLVEMMREDGALGGRR